MLMRDDIIEDSQSDVPPALAGGRTSSSSHAQAWSRHARSRRKNLDLHHSLISWLTHEDEKNLNQVLLCGAVRS